MYFPSVLFSTEIVFRLKSFFCRHSAAVDLFIALLAGSLYFGLGGALYNSFSGLDANFYLGFSNNPQLLIEMFPTTYYSRRFIAFLTMQGFHKIFGLQNGYLILHALCFMTPIYVLLRATRKLDYKLAGRLAGVFLVGTFWYGNLFTSDYPLFLAYPLMVLSVLPVIAAPNSINSWLLSGLIQTVSITCAPGIAVFSIPYVAAGVVILFLSTKYISIIRAFQLVLGFVTGVGLCVFIVEIFWRIWSNSGTKYWRIIIDTSESLLFSGWGQTWFVSASAGFRARPHYLIVAVLPLMSLIVFLSTLIQRNSVSAKALAFGLFVNISNLISWLIFWTLYLMGMGIFYGAHSFDPTTILMTVNLCYLFAGNLGLLHTVKKSLKTLNVATILTVIYCVILVRVSIDDLVFKIVFLLLPVALTLICLITESKKRFDIGWPELLKALTLLMIIFSASLFDAKNQFQRASGLSSTKHLENRQMVVDFQDWVSSQTKNERVRFWYDLSSSHMNNAQSSYLWGWTIATFDTEPKSPVSEIKNDSALISNVGGSDRFIIMAETSDRLENLIQKICGHSFISTANTRKFFGFQYEFEAIVLDSREFEGCLV